MVDLDMIIADTIGLFIAIHRKFCRADCTHIFISHISSFWEFKQDVCSKNVATKLTSDVFIQTAHYCAQRSIHILSLRNMMEYNIVLANITN